MEDQDKTNLPAEPDPVRSGDDVPARSTSSSAGPVGVYPASPQPPLPSYSAGTYSTTPAVETNAWAIVSLIASILSWIGLFGLGGIVGVITGIIARDQIRQSNGRQGGDGIAVAGIILGAVNIILACIGIVCLIAAFAGMFTIPFMDMRFR